LVFCSRNEFEKFGFKSENKVNPNPELIPAADQEPSAVGTVDLQVADGPPFDSSSAKKKKIGK
jgi:hypothetical protein